MEEVDEEEVKEDNEDGDQPDDEKMAREKLRSMVTLIMIMMTRTNFHPKLITVRCLFCQARKCHIKYLTL